MGRLRDKKYLQHIAALPCLICNRPAGTAHHLRRAEKNAMGMKVGDNWVVPLCDEHHKKLHSVGNEDIFWAYQGLDPYEIAEFTYNCYVVNERDMQ